MPQPIVISFDENGSAEWTRTSRFVPFGGDGTMQRVTDIRKHPDKATYYILWMLGPFAGRYQTYGMAISYGVFFTAPTDIALPVSFSSYESAVQHEIAMLNAMRRQGIRFHEQES